MHIRFITTFYILILAVIAALCGTGYYILGNVIHVQKDDASVINIAGRQRMLSQQAALYAVEFADLKDPIEVETARMALKESLDQFEQSHSDIINGNEERGIHGLLTEEDRKLFFEAPHNVDLRVREYITLLRRIQNMNYEERSIDHPDVRYLIVQAQREILDYLEMPVALFEKESQRTVERLIMVEQGVFFSTLLLLLLEAILIFRPLTNKIKQDRQQLLEAYRSKEGILQIAQNNPYPVVQTTFDGKVLFVNKAASELYPTLQKEGFQHPVLADLENFMGVSKMKGGDVNTFEREILYNDVTYQQKVVAVNFQGLFVLIAYCLEKEESELIAA